MHGVSGCSFGPQGLESRAVLAHWVKTKWSRDKNGAIIGKPIEPLPDTLLDLDKFRETDPFSLSDRTRCNNGIRLLAGLGDVRQGWLAADVAMLFDPETRSFKVSATDLADLEERWRVASFHPETAPSHYSAGIGGKLEFHPISRRVYHRVAKKGAELFANVERSLWTAIKQELAISEYLPSALVFHCDILPKPITLTIEATTACNFRCSFCYGRHLKQGVMRLPDFLRVLKNLPPIAAAEFTGEGEPLLNKDVPDMIRACKARGAWVHLTTNGSKMTRKRAELIVDLDVDAVATSIETLDPRRFAELRPGGELADVKHAIELLTEVRAARGHGPELLLWVTLLQSSLGEIDSFLEYAKSAEISKVEFQVLNRLPSYQRFYTPELKAEMLSDSDLLEYRNRPSTSGQARRVIDELLAIHSGRTCEIFRGSTMVYWQGSVTPCRLLKVPHQPSFGDARETHLEQIWQVQDFRTFRFALQHGVVLKACDGCAYVAGA